MHFRTGVRLLIQAEVVSAEVITPGDLLYLSEGKAHPAGSFPWTTDLATTQAAFAAVFLGIAYSGSDAGEDEPVSVDVSPLSFYDAETTASSTIGAMLAPSGTGLALSNRTLEAVAASGKAIGRVVKAADTGETHVGASFASAYFTASANTNAAVG